MMVIFNLFLGERWFKKKLILCAPLSKILSDTVNIWCCFGDFMSQVFSVKMSFFMNRFYKVVLQIVLLGAIFITVLGFQ